jgi:hypothetical protein
MDPGIVHTKEIAKCLVRQGIGLSFWASVVLDGMPLATSANGTRLLLNICRS